MRAAPYGRRRGRRHDRGAGRGAPASSSLLPHGSTSCRSAPTTLIQYTLAIDRAGRSQWPTCTTPGIPPSCGLHSTQTIARAKRGSVESVSVCGEMAGDPAFHRAAAGRWVCAASRCTRRQHRRRSSKRVLRADTRQAARCSCPRVLAADSPARMPCRQPLLAPQRALSRALRCAQLPGSAPLRGAAGRHDTDATVTGFAASRQRVPWAAAGRCGTAERDRPPRALDKGNAKTSSESRLFAERPVSSANVAQFFNKTTADD